MNWQSVGSIWKHRWSLSMTKTKTFPKYRHRWWKSWKSIMIKKINTIYKYRKVKESWKVYKYFLKKNLLEGHLLKVFKIAALKIFIAKYVMTTITKCFISFLGISSLANAFCLVFSLLAMTTTITQIWMYSKILINNYNKIMTNNYNKMITNKIYRIYNKNKNSSNANWWANLYNYNRIDSIGNMCWMISRKYIELVSKWLLKTLMTSSPME